MGHSLIHHMNLNVQMTRAETALAGHAFPSTIQVTNEMHGGCRRSSDTIASQPPSKGITSRWNLCMANSKVGVR